MIITKTPLRISFERFFNLIDRVKCIMNILLHQFLRIGMFILFGYVAIEGRNLT